MHIKNQLFRPCIAYKQESRIGNWDGKAKEETTIIEYRCMVRFSSKKEKLIGIPEKKENKSRATF